jgi:hypothetical protein
MLGTSYNNNEEDGEIIRLGLRQGYQAHNEKCTRVASNLTYP